MKTETTIHRELGTIALLVLACNIGLLFGAPNRTLAFIPAEAFAGSWWQWVTWPLVHVSGYHLLMDLAGFLSVFALLGTVGARLRWGLVVGAVAGSLVVPLMISPAIGTHGLTGLSGPAHGLMAVVALHFGLQAYRASDRPAQWLYGGLLAGVVLKSGGEVLSGSFALATLHLGEVGTPIVSSHLGGVVGALFCYCLLRGGPLACRRQEALPPCPALSV